VNRSSIVTKRAQAKNNVVCRAISEYQKSYTALTKSTNSTARAIARGWPSTRVRGPTNSTISRTTRSRFMRLRKLPSNQL